MDVAELGFVVDSRSLLNAQGALRGVSTAANATAQAAGRFVDATGRMREANGRFVTSAQAAGTASQRMASDIARATSAIDGARSSLGNFIRIAAIAYLVRETAQLADEYTNLNSKIRLVTASEEELVRVRTAVYGIAQRTRQEYGATAELYARLSRSTKELALTEQERLRITETITKAAIISGATATESAAAIRQFTQGLAAGAVRGEEFNSVAEQMPVILDIVSKATGIASGKLRGMAAEGRLTREVLVESLARGAQQVDADFGRMSLTIGGAVTTLKNAILEFTGGADSASESSRGLAEMIQSVARAIELVGPQIHALVALWRGQDTAQKDVDASARQIAEGMKVVVTGLVIAKNGVDALVNALKLAGAIIANWASATSQTFSNMGDLIEKTIERFKSPIGTNDGLLDDFLARQKEIVKGFADESSADFDTFRANLTANISDVADAFEFLNEPLKRSEAGLGSVGVAAGAANGPLVKLGESADETGKRVEKLAVAEKALADLLGGIMGAIDPVSKAREDYNKIERDAIAIKEKIIKLGGDEVAVTAKVAKALDQAAKNRDAEIDALKKKQGAVETMLADMETQLELVNMDADARDKLLAAMDAEEAIIRAINVAKEAGAKITDKQTREHIKAARAIAAETVEAAKLERILSKFDDMGFGGIMKDLDRLKDALRDTFDPEQIERVTVAIGETRQEAVLFATDAIGRGISSLQSMATEGSKAFKALAVAQAAANLAAAIGAVVNQGRGDPYTAFARMAAMAAAVSGLVGSIVSFSANGPSSSGAEARQAAQGRGTVLGDAEAQSESIANAVDITAEATSELVGINRGMLSALLAVQAGISGASGSLARAEFGDLSLARGAGMNSMLNPFGFNGLGARAVSAIFGGGQELIDQGLLVRGGAFGGVSRNPNASTYQTIETEGGWFGSDDVDDELEALGEQASTQIRLILTSIGDTVREGAIALGLDAEEVQRAIDAFEIAEIRISTMDLTGEEAAAELEAVFSSIFDDLTHSVVPFIAQFQQVGEGLGETLIRVATSVQVTQEAMIQLGLALEGLDPEQMAQVSVALIEAAGGIEEFISGMQSFVSNFAPEAHRFAVAQDQVTRAFAQAGLTLPATREGLWDLMQTLDATTESGREQIATLLRLAGVADDYYSGLEDQAEAAADAAREAAEAAASYADFMAQFGARGSDFQNGLSGVARQMEENIRTAHELARATGLAGASETDLIAIRESAAAEMRQMIADLMQSARDQIASLYGTSAEKLQTQLADIDRQIAEIDRSDSTFGFVQAMQREAQLGAERMRIQNELSDAVKREEKLRRRTQALGLAQTLADLTAIPGGMSFDDLVSDLGLDVNAFGRDLGLTAQGVEELIATLRTESLTSDVFGAGIDRLVAAILYGNETGLGANGDLTKPIRFPNEIGLKPDFDGSKEPIRDGAKNIPFEDEEDDRGDVIELVVERIEAGNRVIAELLHAGNVNTAVTADQIMEFVRFAVREEMNNGRQQPRGVYRAPK